MIRISLLSRKFYKLRILPGPFFAQDREKIQTIHDREAVYKDIDGADIFSHWKIPRENIGWILRKWSDDDIVATKKVKKDIKVYRRLLRPLSELPLCDDEVEIEKSNIRLKPDQDKWVHLSKNRRRLLNAFETGAGKTLSALCRCKLMEAQRTIIFTITSVIDQWQDEIKTVYGESEDAVVYVGSIKQREKLQEAVKNAKFVITTYDVGYEIAHFAEFDSFIFDEFHVVRNHTTRTYQRLIPTFQQTWKTPDKLVQIMTATPMGNLPHNLWTIIRLIHPLLAGTYNAFQKRYERVTETREVPTRVKLGEGRYIYVKRKVPKNVRHQNRKALKELLDALMLQSEDAEKSKTYEDISKTTAIEMTPYQKELYQEFKEKLQPELNGRKFKTAEVRTKLLRLLEVAEGPYNLDPDDKHLRFESGKLLHLRRLLKHIQKREASKSPEKRRKVIVWLRFKEGTNILHEWFPDCSVIHNGDLNRNQKLLNKWAFNGVRNERQHEQYRKLAARYGYTANPGEIQFLFGVLHERTSLGMDLQACAYQIFASFSFSGYAMAQTKGRICRIGQRAKRVITEYLVSVGTWEEYVLRYILERYKEVRMSMKGQEILTKDSTIRLLNILRRYG